MSTDCCFQRGTLADELARREKKNDYFQEHIALVMFLQLCEGVQHFHQENSDLGGPYAHRDLKPHNVLLREDLTPILMDLGSVESARVKISTHSEAQYLQDLAAERSSMPYRPPELFQVDSKCDIDERTDVWVSDSTCTRTAECPKPKIQFSVIYDSK